MNAKRKITSVEAEGLFLDCTPIFGLHYSDFIPAGPGSYLCVLCLMAFPYLSLYPEPPGGQHTQYTCQFVI